jgi:hypothetical protein
MREALKSLPIDQLEAYQTIMSRIKEAAEEDPSLPAIHVLSWIFHAPRPLQMEELREALVVKDGAVDLDHAHLNALPATDIVNWCESLVVYDEASGVVRFSHATVQTFLETETLLPVNMLAKTTLTYLGFDDFERASWEDLAYQGMLLKKYKFTLYAAEFWSLHTRGDPENSPEVQRAVFALLASEGKRDSMLRFENYGRWERGRTRPTARCQTLLHVLANHGLATICKAVLQKGSDRYVKLRSADALERHRFPWN